MGEQLEPAAERAGRRQRHVHRSASARASASGRRVYLVGEFIPRLGYEPGVNYGTFGIEKRAGGHVFQLNFSNGFGTTMGQLARGGTGSEDWYLGFNISRKFF